MNSFLHSSNEYLLRSRVNIKFSKLRGLSADEFAAWVRDLKEEVCTSWITHNQPPLKATSEEDVIAQYHRLVKSRADGELVIDGLTQTKDCIVSGAPISAASSFFSNMGKMKDINSKTLDGDSLWSIFVEDSNFSRLMSAAKKNILADSLFQYAPILTRRDKSVGSLTAREWVKQQLLVVDGSSDFWLEPTKLKSKRGEVILLRGDELLELGDGCLDKVRHWAATPTNLETTEFLETIFRIRRFETAETVFPKAFHAFRQGLVVMGVNFPPTIAKSLYKKFTNDLPKDDPIKIYDPSAGYGGRLLGALSLINEKKVHYIGTDPNPDNWVESIGLSRYELMGRHFQANVRGRYSSTYEVHKCGSEVFCNHEAFSIHAGSVDLVFTSPPYFAAEGYSDDENQSFKKFPAYELWREGFLRKTLENCSLLLKRKRWLLWNIADVSFDGKLYPLERDSVEIAKSLGFQYRHRIKMVLSGALTGKKVSKKTRQPTTKNYCAINNKYRKYEPIFCFFKP
jgi:hypothetical protein